MTLAGTWTCFLVVTALTANGQPDTECSASTARGTAASGTSWVQVQAARERPKRSGDGAEVLAQKQEDMRWAWPSVPPISSGDLPWWAGYAAAGATELGLLAAWLAYRSWSRRAGAGSQSEKVDRSALLDNAKAWCILFVIIGHWCFGYLVYGYGPGDEYTWFQGANDSINVVYLVATNWSMSLFCFISGLCSQGPPTPARIRNYMQYLVVPTLLWVGIFHGIFAQLLVNKPVPAWYLARPVSGEWYLSSLVLWRAASFLFFHKVPAWLLMPLSQLVSFAVGYFRLGGDFGGETWYFELLQPGITLAFLPYYVIGYLFPLGTVLRAIPEPRVAIRLLVALLVAVWSLVVAPVTFGADPHFAYSDSTNNYANMTTWQIWLFWHGRLVRWGVDMVPSLAVLFLVLPRGETSYTWTGAHTLYPYLFHHVALDWRGKILQLFHLPVVTSTAGHVLVLALHVPYWLLCVALPASAFWRGLFDWMLKPKWLDPIADAMQAGWKGGSH
mmetsp:Transcript_79455/g.224727  ORF Transcript_79455/g.224727 Transcript_79455/m.224727 type:complete len:501 (-) Transcript_79455:84-1586(-)